MSRIEIPFAKPRGASDGVFVIVGEEMETLVGTLIAAPDTRFHKPVAILGLGQNYYGPLDEEFFVCPINDFDPEYRVLWVASSASQYQDDRARLTPVCLLPSVAIAGEDDEEEGDPEKLAFVYACLLMYGYIRMTVMTWGRTYDDVEFHRCTPAMCEVVQAAMEGLPFPVKPSGGC